MGARFAEPLTAALALGMALPGMAGGVELVGTTEATLEWPAASGPVAGYYVIVARNDQAPRLAGTSDDRRETVSGSYGDVLVVQVAAFDAGGVAGPLSPPSDPISFVPASSDGGSGGGGSGGGGSEEPPDDGSGSGGSGAGEVVPGTPLDFTGDGRSDLIVLAGRDLSLWAMDGASVAATAALPAAPGAAQPVGSGDYDGNGVADLLWEDAQAGTRQVWLFEGGAVSATAALEGSLESGADWRVAGSGDFDADGRDDVLLASRVLGEAEIWLLDGTVVTARVRIAGRVGAWSVAAVVDADADGRAEIVWRDEVDHTLELDDPDGPTTEPLAQGMKGWRVVGSGDYDGDGRADLALHAPETGEGEVWSLDGATVTAIQALAAGGARPWSVHAAGDYDGDGRTDRVWSEPDSGEVSIALAPQAGLGQPVDPLLPAGGTLASAARGADETAFRARLCDADLNDNGAVTSEDFRILADCYVRGIATGCEAADLDGDGAIGQADVEIFTLRYSGESCE